MISSNGKIGGCWLEAFSTTRKLLHYAIILLGIQVGYPIKDMKCGGGRHVRKNFVTVLVRGDQIEDLGN